MAHFNHGDISIDESSTAAQLRQPVDVPNFPEPEPWKESILRWLRYIDGNSDVAYTVLDALGNRSASPRTAGTIVCIDRFPEPDLAFTNGPFNAGMEGNPTGRRAVFVSMSPSDAYRGPSNLDPMRNPPSVLLHELVHALMGVHSLNAPDAVSGWSSTAYPNHNEFCATTIQNMMLSEKGVMLADGYSESHGHHHGHAHGSAHSNDDPHIQQVASDRLTPGPLGIRSDPGRSRLEVADFVSANEVPLGFLVAGLPRLTNRLANMSHIKFNPFAELRRRRRAAGRSRGARSAFLLHRGPLKGNRQRPA